MHMSNNFFRKISSLAPKLKLSAQLWQKGKLIFVEYKKKHNNSGDESFNVS